MLKKMIAVAGVAIGMQTLPAHATLISYNGFASTTGLTMAGDAKTVTTTDGTVMRLTSATTGQGGAAYYTTPFTLGANSSFSTSFQFRMTNPGGLAPADGITFILSNSASGLGSSGVGLGLPSASKSVAIEFDTFNNGAIDNYSSNNVGIDINGNTASAYQSPVYGITNCGASTYKTTGCMADGNLWTVNIGYDGSKLNVTLGDAARSTTYSAISNYAIDIGSILGANQAYVGFTGSTGSGYENQDILNWQFSSTTQLAVASSNVPEPAALALFGVGLAGIGFASRRKKR